jgi:hypothetical protein
MKLTIAYCTPQRAGMTPDTQNAPAGVAEKQPVLAQEKPPKPAEKPGRPLSNVQESGAWPAHPASPADFLPGDALRLPSASFSFASRLRLAVRLRLPSSAPKQLPATVEKGTWLVLCAQGAVDPTPLTPFLHRGSREPAQLLLRLSAGLAHQL